MPNLFVTKIVCRKDVARILGVSAHTAGRILNKIRTHYGKGKGQCVLLNELCSYEGMAVAAAEAALE